MSSIIVISIAVATWTIISQSDGIHSDKQFKFNCFIDAKYPVKCEFLFPKAFSQNFFDVRKVVHIAVRNTGRLIIITVCFFCPTLLRLIHSFTQGQL